jgi:GTP-binding protein EngB required for normal cell division
MNSQQAMMAAVDNAEPEAVNASRFDFLCRATEIVTNAGARDEMFVLLLSLLRKDLRQLAEQESPPDFLALSFALEQELERLRQFSDFPYLAEKVVVAFGGAFSAGKSSLINALLGKKLLVTEVDPTTSLPTYLLKGEADVVLARNLFGKLITLSADEFASLTHDEPLLYGTHISQLLQAAMITRSDFPWQNLAFIDTPGYTKHDDSHGSARTDEQLARSQLNAAQAIVWVISAKDGGIKEEDIQFLASLEPTIPRLVVVSRADQVPEADIDRIVETIQQRLQERNLAPLAIVPVSSRKPERFSQQLILEQLQLWNAEPRTLQFAQNFKRLFRRYEKHLADQQRLVNLYLNRLNRLLSAAPEDEALAMDIEALKLRELQRLAELKEVSAELEQLQRRFFIHIKAVCDDCGIAFPDLAALELLGLSHIDLLALLHQERQAAGQPAPDACVELRALLLPAAITNQAALLRRMNSAYTQALSRLQATPTTRFWPKPTGLVAYYASAWQQLSPPTDGRCLPSPLPDMTAYYREALSSLSFQ